MEIEQPRDGHTMDDVIGDLTRAGSGEAMVQERAHLTPMKHAALWRNCKLRDSKIAGLISALDDQLESAMVLGRCCASTTLMPSQRVYQP